MAKLVPHLLLLPRELRQMILQHLFNGEILRKDGHFVLGLICLDYVLNSPGPMAAPYAHAVATIMKAVHPVIGEDLKFVLERYLRAFEDRCDCTRRDLAQNVIDIKKEHGCGTIVETVVEDWVEKSRDGIMRVLGRIPLEVTGSER